MTSWPCISKWINLLWGLDSLLPCKLSLIEPVDTAIENQAEASAVQYISKKGMCCVCYFLDFRGAVFIGMNVQFIQSKKRKDLIPLHRTAPGIWICCYIDAHWCSGCLICISLECISAFSVTVLHVNIVERVSEMFCGEIPFQGSMALPKPHIRKAVKYTPL